MVQRTTKGSWAAVFRDNAAVQCFWERGGGATDNGGGCSGVLVFYLHMGMGEIHWREEGDPIVIRIHLLCVGWRNLCLCCCVIFFLAVNRFWFYILLMYLEYHNV